MSASAGDQSLKDALECPVCKDLFMEPKQLECGHTYCLNCVNGLEKVPNIVHRIVGEEFFDTLGVGPFSSLVQSVQNNVQCPQCRKMCLVPDTGLSTNYAIKDMVEKLRQNVQLEDDCAPFLLFEGTKQQTKKDQHKHCHSCAKKVPDSELFICKDCNNPTQKLQIICALCVVFSHKQHTVVTFDCLAVAHDRELAAMHVEEILSLVKRMGDEVRTMQYDITKQFETTREKVMTKANTFYQLQNECLNDEQNPLKEQIESKVNEAMHKCEQLNEHFLSLRELKTEFEAHLKRWQEKLVADDVPPLLTFSSCTSSSPQFLRGLVVPSADNGPTTSSRRHARPSHFVFTNYGSGGDDGRGIVEFFAGNGSNTSNNSSKKAQPILVAQRRRSRLRGVAGGGPSSSNSNASSSTSASVSMLPAAQCVTGVASESERKQEPELFSFLYQ